MYMYDGSIYGINYDIIVFFHSIISDRLLFIIIGLYYIVVYIVV